MESRKVFFRGSSWRGSKNSQDGNSLISLILMHENCRHESKHGTQTHMMAQKRTFTLPGGSFSGSMLVFRGCIEVKVGKAAVFDIKAIKATEFQCFLPSNIDFGFQKNHTQTTMTTLPETNSLHLKNWPSQTNHPFLRCNSIVSYGG